MLAGMILGAVLVIAVLMLVGQGRTERKGERSFLGFAVVGLAIAGVITVVVVGTETGASDTDIVLPRSHAALAGSTNDALARAIKATSGLGTSSPSSQSAGQVASVPTLVTGLERRLESEPGDASGWALLAQSYAYIGDADRAEGALLRAVELGLDEADLRQRVDGARRDPHSGMALAPAR